MRRALAMLLLAGLVSVFQVKAEDDGVSIYQRECAACHLQDGAGVPGTFPRLTGRTAGFASTKEGRAYLVAVVLKGMTGAIDVDGMTIAGVMPPKASLTDEQLARVLNALLTMSPPTSVATPFTESEVSSARAAHASLTMQDVARLRPQISKAATP